MKVDLPFGDSFLSVEVPSGAKVVEPINMPPLTNPAASMLEALRSPTGTPPLRELARGRKSVAIVINDVTRPSPSRLMLEALLKELAAESIPEEAVNVVVATGNHRPSTPQELEEMLGPELAGRLRIINHDCLDDANQTYAGTTAAKLPVYVNRWVAEADLKILTGIITPHHIAGYSGGRKSIVPGVAGYETIRLHHSPPLRPLEPVLGKMWGNSFHEEAVGAARLVGIDFILNAVKNIKGEITEVVAGELEAAHEKGVRSCEKAWKIGFNQQYDIVLVSPGNYPKDINLHQAQKAISAAEQVAVKGGVIILVAECRDKIGKFGGWLKQAKNPQEVIDRFIKVGFTKDHSSKAFMFARALVNHKIIVVCKGISPQELEEMFFESAPSVEAAIRHAMDLKGPEANILFLPHAGECVPMVEG